MRHIYLIVVLFSIFVNPLPLHAATFWVAAEYYDDFVDDPGDGVEAFTFEGRNALTGGGVYFTEENPVQGAVETTYFEYDLGECPKDDDGQVWRAWGRFEWTGGISGCKRYFACSGRW